MTRTKAPGRRCRWRHCDQPAAATVAFKLPNLLAGSRRDYCAEHTRQVRLAKGTVVAARLGPRGQSTRLVAATPAQAGGPSTRCALAARG